MKKLWELFKLHPGYALITAGVLALVLVIGGDWISHTVETYRNNKFDAAMKAKEKEVSALTLERDAAVKRADDAESKALLKEAEATELKELIAAKGGQIAVAQKDLERKLEDAKKDAGTCSQSSDPVQCVCFKLRTAGFNCN